MKPKLDNENRHKRIIEEVGHSSFRIFDKDNPFVQTICPQLRDTPFVAVCLSTGDTAQRPFTYEGIYIPEGSDIIIQRVFRYCEHNGTPHLNADDVLYFPDKKGNIIRIFRNDAPDHWLKIAGFSGLTHIAKAYHLPTATAGPANSYAENGALVPILMDCPGTDIIKIEHLKWYEIK